MEMYVLLVTIFILATDYYQWELLRHNSFHMKNAESKVRLGFKPHFYHLLADSTEQSVWVMVLQWMNMKSASQVWENWLS